MFPSKAPSSRRVVSSSCENRTNVGFTLPIQVRKVSLSRFLFFFILFVFVLISFPLLRKFTQKRLLHTFRPLILWFWLRCGFLSFRENEEENLAHTVFTQYVNEQENQMEGELAFDASFFKANRKVMTDKSFKRIRPNRLLVLYLIWQSWWHGRFLCYRHIMIR